MNRQEVLKFRWWKIDAAGMLACVALCMVGYWFAVAPVVNRNLDSMSKRSEISYLRAESSQSSTRINELQAVAERLKQEVQENPPLHLLSSQHSNQRLAELTDLAEEHDMQLEHIKLGNVSEGEQFNTVSIHVAGKGSFQAFTILIDRLNYHFPDTNITVLELTDNPSDPDEETKFKLNLAWYTVPTLASAEK